MNIIKTNNADSRFKKLCCMLDNYLNDAIGKEKQQKEYNQHNALVDIDDVILLIDGENSYLIFFLRSGNIGIKAMVPTKWIFVPLLINYDYK